STYYHNYEDFNLDEMIQLRINHYEEKLNEKSLVVDFQKTNGITAVRSDQYLLSRVMDHLLDNAVKFSNEKTTIKIKLETDDNSRTITVENECDPIPDHEQANLFDKYTQYIIHESTRKHGVGLGLAFCEHALKSIQSNIELISPIPEKDDGVCVTIKIPKEIDEK
ncbi:MAG: sensor histidine kinase, partial [Candidatus Kariarchaeaceae archaeon]